MMFLYSFENNNYRYERKFFISDLTKYEVESIIKLHPAMFSEIYYQRFVNNIYFDSEDLTNYFDNIVGSPYRIKFRIRWYGELFTRIEQPVLELKVKCGIIGEKESFILNPFELNNNFNFQTISDIINKSDIPELIKVQFKLLKPTLINRYARKYFQSADKNYRLTMDTDLTFYQIFCKNDSFLKRLNNHLDVILELKYAKDKDDNAQYIANYFPFRMTKSSKYVNGVEKLFIYY